MTPRREPVSLICVFSDATVRERCLDRSLEEHRNEGAVEYLPVDNTEGAFATAGEALNHGASLATNEWIAFVHQDVYLHSIRALEQAAGALADDPGIGVIGAAGITAGGEPVGRIRDRVILAGTPAVRPSDVDSVDEVLFMTSRSLLERMPLSEAPELAWHAYAVELGLRAASRDLRVCALDIPLTHNSLNVNVDRLDAAYAHLAALYPGAMPLRATLRENRAAHADAVRRRLRLRSAQVALPMVAGVAGRACGTIGGERQPVGARRHPHRHR